MNKLLQIQKNVKNGIAIAIPCMHCGLQPRVIHKDTCESWTTKGYFHKTPQLFAEVTRVGLRRIWFTFTRYRTGVRLAAAGMRTELILYYHSLGLPKGAVLLPPYLFIRMRSSSLVYLTNLTVSMYSLFLSLWWSSSQFSSLDSLHLGPLKISKMLP